MSDLNAGERVSAAAVLEELERVLVQRKRASPESSYTARLFEGGVEAIGAKIVEEAAELVAAARDDEGRAAVVHEAADLIYHALVLLAHQDVPLVDVLDELARRRARSGLARE